MEWGRITEVGERLAAGVERVFEGGERVVESGEEWLKWERVIGSGGEWLKWEKECLGVGGSGGSGRKSCS